MGTKLAIFKKNRIVFFLFSFLLLFFLCGSVSAEDYTDIRYDRTGSGLEISAPAKTKNNVWFPVTIVPGSVTIDGIYFSSQSGYWNPLAPASYEYSNLGLSFSSMSFSENESSQFGYYIWWTTSVPSDNFDFMVKAEQDGFLRLRVTYTNSNGVKAESNFSIEVGDFENGQNSSGQDAGYNEGYAAGLAAAGNGQLPTIGADLSISMPSANYFSLLGNMSLWANFRYNGVDSSGQHTWTLIDSGQN